jgi:octaprenyl-diphosphate synthase
VTHDLDSRESVTSLPPQVVRGPAATAAELESEAGLFGRDGALASSPANSSGFFSDGAVSSMAPAVFSAVSDLIESDLQAVEERLRASLQHPRPEVSEILEYVGHLSGKRLRPTLCLLSWHACGRELQAQPIASAGIKRARSPSAVELAVVVELVHTATLIHDDILDRATHRRHRLAVHRRWDRHTAILAGDWLFSTAYGLANSGDSTHPGRQVAEAGRQMCEGEMLQHARADRFDCPLDDYLEILRLKTGALCGVACWLGAWASGADEADCQNLYRFGERLGVAFQLQDDWLDMFGRADSTGKNVGADLRDGKATLPVLRLLDQMTASARQSVIAQLRSAEPDERMEILRPLLACSDADAFTRQFAIRQVRLAAESLDRLADSPANDALRRLAGRAVQREF